MPIGIVHFDQGQFPIPVPLLHSLFPGQGGFAAFMSFKPDQQLYVMLGGKPWHGTALMLKDSAIKIVRLADIEGAVAA